MSERRRSGVWQSAATDVMTSEKESRKQRLAQEKRREPSLYDSYLTEERRAVTQQQKPRPESGARRTIRAITPEGRPAGAALDSQLSERSSMTFQRPFVPHTTTTTPVVGAAVAVRNSPTSSGRSRKFSNERDTRHTGRSSQASSPLGGQSGSGSVGSKSFMGRSNSRNNGRRTRGSIPDYEIPSRPRTRTMDDRTRRDQSPTALMVKNRDRVRSVHTPASSPYQGGAEYLASVPVATETPAPPSMSSLGSPMNSPLETAEHRSPSPTSSSTVDSITSALPSANARRILHLMKTLNGRMSGKVIYRRGLGNPWAQSYCYIHEESGSLIYESRASEGRHKMLIGNLHGAKVRSNLDGEIPYLEISVEQTGQEVHLKVQTQSDFDAWFAALLHWTPRDAMSLSSNDPRPDSEMDSRLSTTGEASKRRASIHNPLNRQGRDRAASEQSQTSDRRKSVVASVHKENPVIKIGKMIYWDTDVAAAGAVGQSANRPNTYRMQSIGARRWRKISGQLRENGELKLHSDADNSLISVVQLSQLSRCAIQRLDRSVLESDFCIAIYPQYTSSYTATEQKFIRPIFLSLESRVLYEVWFVLLRAFTMPSIYGPRADPDDRDDSTHNSLQDLESMIATSHTYAFRMERSLSVRVVEAKMQSPSASTNNDSGFSGGYSRQQANSAPEKSGFYAEVCLDNETRGKTVVKYDGLNPLWGETFEYQDLPPVLSSASIVVKRRPPEQAAMQQDPRQIHDANGEQQGGFTPLAFDVTCGKVDIQAEELEPDKEIEKWWPVINMHGNRVGEVMVKLRADECIVLMARDYRQLSNVLHRFSNGLTLQIAQMIPSELKRLSDCFLNIFQVSGKAGDWIMALVEEEIDGNHKETPITRLRYSKRAGSNDTSDALGTGGGTVDREMIVRDLNKNAALEANLLFRGNTLLTKSLDTNMRRVGKEYLEESLAAKLQEINEKDLDCEVDPNRVASPQDVDRNWRRLLLCTQEVWKGIVANQARCPIELRIIFRHIRACAEDRYGDFLRSVSYSSVSGFLFLRFFCPAVLNPKLFGLLKDDVKPRARRAFTLIAKSLQTMANMAAFGTKEPWMEPMNAFLVQHREGFKTFIDDICYVPAPLSSATFGPNPPTSPGYPPGVISAGQHLSYTTPTTIMQRLPPSSREGFPSLPFLIDQARAFADLIHLWLDATNALSDARESTALPGKTRSDITHAIEASEGEMKEFHYLCEELSFRTQECLSRAERAERPDSPHEFQWEDVINQLQKAQVQDTGDAVNDGSEHVAGQPNNGLTRRPGYANPAIEATLAQLRGGRTEDMDEETPPATQVYSRTPPHSEPAFLWEGARNGEREWPRPGSSSHAGASRGGRLGSATAESPRISAAASVGNLSSGVSSDAEPTPTALPSYDREVRHRERREAARVQIQQQMEAARVKEKDKERRKMNKLVPALRKKKQQQQDKESPAAARGHPGPPPYDGEPPIGLM